MRNILTALCVVVAPAWCVAAQAAQAPDRLVVVELFTSQGCSSCPPADRLLADLAATRSDILALDFHVTYWNDLGWTDPYSFEASTLRQDRYAHDFGDREVYTPEMIVDGRTGFVGSDRDAAERAIDAASRENAVVPLRLSAGASGLDIAIGGGEGAGEILLVGFDGAHETHVGAGENDGRTLHEVDIVRSLQSVGSWHGSPMMLHLARPPGEHAAILLQSADGRIIGAARAPTAG